MSKVETNREKTGGRQKGTLNKVTVEIKGFARKFGREAIEKAVETMRSAESEQARMAAINTILDRAYGKPSQALTGEDGGPIEALFKTVYENRD